jgi:hypothetical protein
MLDKELVRRVVHRQMNQLRYCYELALLERPTLVGRVEVELLIAPHGDVVGSSIRSSTANDTALEVCIVDTIRRWKFPAVAHTNHNHVYVVHYPFVFARAGSPAKNISVGSR